MEIDSIRHMTVEEYFAYDEAIEYKSEYIDGVVYPMMSGTASHAAIVVNAACAVWERVKSKQCRALMGNMRIGVSPSRFLYPDFSVYCGKPELDERKLNPFNPTLLGEVKSPYATVFEDGNKRDYFRRIPSLQVYLQVDQNDALVQVDTRETGTWYTQEYAGLDAVISLPAIGCELPLAEIYAGISF